MKDFLENISLIEEILPYQIELYFNKSKKTICFWDRLQKITNPYVFGGFIVDLLKGNKSHRDIDIVVSHFNDECFDLLTEYEGKKNSFGGYKLSFDGVKVDIWEIKRTWSIRKMNYMDFDLFSLLPSTVFFNSTAILFSVKDKKLIFKESFLKYIKNNTLEIVNEDNPFPELCILKTYQNHLNGVIIALSLKRYVLKKYKISNDNLEKMQIKHFSKVKYSKNELNDWYETIKFSFDNTYSDKEKNQINKNITRLKLSEQLELF